ncbi:MAG: SH3 domain-containing protein [Firmicutes bacterium]|nr:SH3 domain-containing protein [Bacillota bacterium]
MKHKVTLYNENTRQTYTVEQTGSYTENLAPVLINGKFGYVDPDNQFVIEPRFWGASDFNQGIAVVCLEDSGHPEEIVYIDNKGNIVKTFLDVLKENATKEDILMKEYYSVMASSGLQMRSRLNSNGERIMLIPFGEKVKVLRKTDIPMKAEGLHGFWYLVEYNGQQGYVFSGFLSRVSIKDFYKDYFSKWFGEFTPEAKIYLEYNMVKYLYNDPSGIIYIFAAEIETDNTVATMYIPHISLQEAFWFLKNYLPELMVLKVGDDDVRTKFKNLNYPINNGRIKLCLESEIDISDMIISEDEFGYVKIIY